MTIDTRPQRSSLKSFFICIWKEVSKESLTNLFAFRPPHHEFFSLRLFKSKWGKDYKSDFHSWDFHKDFPSLNSLWLSFNWTNFYEKSQRVFFIIFYFSWEKCRRPIVNNNKNKLHHFWTAVTKIISRFERNYNAIKRYCGRLRGWTISPSFSVFSVVVDPTVK